MMRVAYALVYDCLAAGGKRHALMWIQAAWVAALVPVLLGGARTLGIVGVGIGHVVVAAGLVGPLFLWALRTLGISSRSLVLACLRPLIGGSLMAATSLLVIHLTDGGVAGLAAAAAAATGVYLPIVLPMRGILRRPLPAPSAELLGGLLGMKQIRQRARPGDLAQRHILWLDASSWGGIPGTGRLLAEAMTPHADVLFVDRPVSPLTSARQRGDLGRRMHPALTSAGDRMIRLSPVAMPGLSRPGIRSSTGPLVRAQLRWALRRTGFHPDAVVTTQLEVLPGRLDGALGVLYATDDYVAGAELMGVSADWLRAQERRALATADVVAVASPRLAEHWASLGADPVLIPNGCTPPGTQGLPLPPADIGLPGPVVVLAGHLSDRIDLAVLEAIAAAGYSLLLVGPHDPRFEPARFAALTTRPLVRHTGPVPASKARAYMAAADVGITPYSNSPFNDASFPLKTLEYLSAGTPVVSTAIPAAHWLLDDVRRAMPSAAGEVLELASGPAGFVAAIGRMTSEPGRLPHGRGRFAGESGTSGHCRAFAARHSWPRRAEALAAVIGIAQSRTGGQQR
jgi:teichuronic acid biosynthesis glycosyltransferase TuaH